MSKIENKRIALALSGGGIRAMVFHLGVLKYLAEQDSLEKINRVSTVSGGSLIFGLLLQMTDLKWPSSQDFLQKSLPALRTKLCSRSLMWDALKKLRSPKNLRYFFSRANLIALALRDEWKITGMLEDLPAIPEWSINGTTAETGKRFRFKKDSFGDYLLGYVHSQSFPLAEAIAVSAAFPGGIGPLVIDVNKYDWRKRANWGESLDQAVPVEIQYKHLHLYDGGVYDNLGLEPFFDAGKGDIKKELRDMGEIIIVSDAGAPLKQGFSLFALNPWRLKRVLDLISDQTRALRIRTFINFLKKSEDNTNGTYLYIGDPISNNFPCDSAVFASEFPTTLRKLSEDEFDRLLNHGYQVTLKNFEADNKKY